MTVTSEQVQTWASLAALNTAVMLVLLGLLMGAALAVTIKARRWRKQINAVAGLISKVAKREDLATFLQVERLVIVTGLMTLFVRYRVPLDAGRLFDAAVAILTGAWQAPDAIPAVPPAVPEPVVSPSALFHGE